MIELADAAEFGLGEIEAGFVRRFDPHRALVRASSQAWLREQRLMPADRVCAQVEDLCYSDLVAGYHVGGPVRVLSAITDFSSWFFMWDDQHDLDIAHRRDHAGHAGPTRYARHQHTASRSPSDPLVTVSPTAHGCGWT